MRPLKHEIRSLVTVGILTGGIALSFPMGALSFSAARVAPTRPASAAFVTLTPEGEAAALKAARTAWQTEVSATDRMRAQLPLGELPEDDGGSVLDLSDFGALADGPVEPVAYRFPAYRPSLAAPRPRPLAPVSDEVPSPAFSRAEMLDFN